MLNIGAPGWRSRLSVRLQPGHDLAVCEFEPRVRLWADGSEPGACFRFCVSLSLCPSPIHALSLSVSKINKHWGACVAQSVKRPTSAQVMILRSVSLSPALGFGLMAQSLEPASDSVSPSLSAPPPFMLCLSLSQK